MIPLNESFRYILQKEAAIEDFEDGSLMLLCLQQKIIELNPSARRVISLMDGKRNLRQVIEKVARDHKLKEKDVSRDIQELVMDLGEQGAIKPLVKVTLRRRKKMDKSSSLLGNPDVSLREEDDGALLFNADTNALLVINPIGLVIWKFTKVHPRTRADIVAHLKEACEDVPSEQVEADVDKFIVELQSKGFIGEVLDEKKIC
jgi:hypothetical protein